MRAHVPPFYSVAQIHRSSKKLDQDALHPPTALNGERRQLNCTRMYGLQWNKFAVTIDNLRLVRSLNVSGKITILY